MLEKLLEIVLAAKSGALSGVLIVAGTVVTVTAGGGVTVVHLDPPSPSIEAPMPELDEDEDEDDDDPDEDKGPDEPKDRQEARPPVAAKPETTCATGEAARTEARERVSSAFVTFRSALDELRAAHRGERPRETLEKAEAMLREIAEGADRALAEMCDDIAVVADRAVAAMETVVNLAKSAAEATPSPRPTDRPKPKQEKRATEKPKRTPSCDDRLYESKLKMHAAFEKYHTLHDKLYFAYKRTSSALAKIVIANDELMHKTYDESKHAIFAAGCSPDMGAAIAARAAATFERAYQSSAQAVSSQGR